MGDEKSNVESMASIGGTLLDCYSDSYESTPEITTAQAETFSTFGDVECGEPMESQHIVIDFTPNEEDTDAIQEKCCAFWEFFESQPELKKMMVEPDIIKENPPSEPISQLLSIDTDSTPAMKTAVSMLDIIDEKGLINRAFAPKMPQSKCTLGSREYKVDDSITRSPKPILPKKLRSLKSQYHMKPSATKSQFHMSPGPMKSQYHLSPGTMKSQYHMSPGATKSQYHMSPGATKSQYHMSPGATKSQYHMSPSAKKSQYHMSPSAKKSQYHMTPGALKSQFQMSPSQVIAPHSSPAVRNMCHQLNEWTNAHPKSMEPPGHPPALSHCVMQRKQQPPI